MRKILEWAVSFSVGAALYCVIEILWRGHTHWTMAIAGGLCLTAIYYLYKCCRSVPLSIRCVAGATVILAVEFLMGFTVNIVLDWNVWDYSNKSFNICGQICPLYAFYWFILCIPANCISKVLCSIINKNRTNNEKVEYFE